MQSEDHIFISFGITVRTDNATTNRSHAWEARVLPLNDTRDRGDCTLNPAAYSDRVGSLTGDDWGPLFWLTRWTFQQASLNLRF